MFQLFNFQMVAMLGSDVKLTVVNVILTLLDRHPLPVQWDTVWFSAALHHQSVPGGLAGVCVVLPEWHAYTVGAHMRFSQVVCRFRQQ